MNGHHQGHNPHSPLAMLYTHSAAGEAAPEGFAWNGRGQLVQLAYQPWAEGPQLPWDNNFDNDQWLSLKQNRSTIELQPNRDPSVPSRYGKDPLGRSVPPLTHADVTLVPESAYMAQDDSDDAEPTQENGTLALVTVGGTGAISRISYRLSKSLVSYVEVPSPDAEFALSMNDPTQQSPLNVPFVQVTPDAQPIGGCVSLTKFSFGHLGTQFNAIYDVPPGEIIRVPVGASFTQNDALLAPKYYNSRTDTHNIRIYILFPGGPDLTSAKWNTLSQEILPRNAFVGLTANPNTVPFMGFVANSAAYTNTTFTQPKRRFYGSVFTDSAAALPTPYALPAPLADMIAQCPVAWFASQVTLVANPGLNFVVQGLTSSAGVTQMWGPFPANTPITIPAGATSILVFPVVKPLHTGVVRFEEPFELDYDLSM